ncbi:MAG: hypothetical protein ACE5OO_04660, partial [Candidatus Bathyarchaeia archaeon]
MYVPFLIPFRNCLNVVLLMIFSVEYMKSVRIVGVFAITMFLISMFPAALAKGPTGKAGKSNTGHLYLFEKDPTTWEIVEDGAWGKMKYKLSGPEFAFVFNGHDLEPGEDYTLIYYPNPWPGNGLICLGSGTANEEGNVHIAESLETDDLPAEEDENYPGGAKIWLVLSDDVDCAGRKMFGWNPTEYLFEYDL